MNSKMGKTVMAAMFAALCFVATYIITVPTFNGYVNIGDCMVLMSGWMLGPVYGFFSAAIGVSLADLAAGYAMYAPATFVIKGLMALAAFCIAKALYKKTSDFVCVIVSGVVAEIVMVLGYYLFEGLLYGFIPSVVNIPTNGLQGVVGLVLGVLIFKVLRGIKTLPKFGFDAK